MTKTSRHRSRRTWRTGGSQKGWPLFFYGLAFFVVGVIITVATYATASSGGTYIVSYGPMAIGLFAMARGLIQVVRNRKAGSQQDSGAAGPALAAAGDGQPGGAFQYQGASHQDGYQQPGGFREPGGAAAFQPGGFRQPGGAAAFQPGGSGQPAAATQPRSRPAGSGGGAAASAGIPGFGYPEPSGAAPAHQAAAPAAPGLPGPNWYADPQDASQLRWWDGYNWTGHTRPRS